MNLQVTYIDANTVQQIVELKDCVWRGKVLSGQQLINRVWVRRRIHKSEIVELKPLHELPNHHWNYIQRTASKAKMDSELKISSRAKHKPKQQQPKEKIRRKVMKQIDLTGKYSPVPDLEKATNDALAEWYNKHSGSTIQLDAKSKRETLVSKVTGLKQAMDELAARATSPSTKQASIKQTKMSKTKTTKAVKTAKGKKAAKGKAPKKAKASSLSNMLIYKKVDKNPRREGTQGFKSFALVRNGMPYLEFIDKGGRNKDLRCDVDKGNLELKPNPKAKA
jgi:hypothetical protein